MQVSDVLLFGEVWSWGDVAARSASSAVAMVVFSAAALRFSAVARERADVGRVVSTGVLPAAAGAEWRGRLTAERRRLHSNRRGVPGLAALVAVLLAVVSLAPRGPGGAGWILAAGLALGGGLLSVRDRRRLRTADRLLAELGERPVAEGESTHAGDGSPSA